MEQYIFYGAGKWAATYVKAYAKHNIKPVCFVDKDKNKHHTFLHEVEILSLEDARKKYPNAKIIFSVFKKLRSVIEKEVIETGLICKDDILDENQYFPKYKSCDFIQNQCVISSEKGKISLGVCCLINVNQPPTIITDINNLEKGITDFIELKKSIIKNASEDSYNYCKDCKLYREDNWLTPDEISYINIIGYGPCQFKCSYCNLPEHKENWTNSLEFEAEFIDKLKEKKYIDDDCLVAFAKGEFAIYQDEDLKKIADAIEGFTVEIFTNAGVYSEFVSKLMKKESASITVSMDCGTKETFKKIKGLDVYEKTCENLAMYANEDVNINLKYIIMNNINDNLDDAKGFIELAKKINAKQVQVSSDAYSADPISSNALKIIDYLEKETRKAGIQFVPSLAY